MHRWRDLHKLCVIDDAFELRVVESPLLDLSDLLRVCRHRRIHVQLLSRAALACDVERVQLAGRCTHVVSVARE